MLAVVLPGAQQVAGADEAADAPAIQADVAQHEALGDEQPGPALRLEGRGRRPPGAGLDAAQADDQVTPRGLEALRVELLAQVGVEVEQPSGAAFRVRAARRHLPAPGSPRATAASSSSAWTNACGRLPRSWRSRTSHSSQNRPGRPARRAAALEPVHGLGVAALGLAGQRHPERADQERPLGLVRAERRRPR